ncbi:hypothetical protein VTK73DRAFT_5718 [Phialemonium thermophilum]|uniref:FAR-17a/AIG1-like protein n=1 Tax=Phialemonium thermophilum TaxID=223376 RepID=A0ABR3XWX1_9PEZI
MAKHPLQRLASPSRSISAVVHLVGLTSFAASFLYLVSYPTPLSEAFGGQFQFLTTIGLFLAMVTFAVGLLADITLSPGMFAAKNSLSVCSAPLEILVSILYWSICLIDKGLVVPSEFALPFLPDFGMHAMPAIMLAVDLILFSPPWAVKSYNALVLSMTLAVLYWIWIEFCFSKNGWYPYPIFEVLNTWQRVLLFSTSAALMTGSTMALKWLYGKLNGIEQLKRDALHPTKID